MLRCIDLLLNIDEHNLVTNRLLKLCKKKELETSLVVLVSKSATRLAFTFINVKARKQGVLISLFVNRM